MTQKIKNYLKNNGLMDLKLFVSYLNNRSKSIQWTKIQKETINILKKKLELKKIES